MLVTHALTDVVHDNERKEVFQIHEAKIPKGHGKQYKALEYHTGERNSDVSRSSNKYQHCPRKLFFGTGCP